MLYLYQTWSNLYNVYKTLPPINFYCFYLSETDLIPLFATFFACLFIGLEYGILIGVATNLLFVLYPSARPPVKIEERKIITYDVYIVTPTKNLLFPSAEYVREKIMKKCTLRSSVVVINCEHLNSIDATVAKVSIHCKTKNRKKSKRFDVKWAYWRSRQ